MQIIVICAPDTHFAAVFAGAFLGCLFRADRARNERAEATFGKDLDRDEEIIHHAFPDGKLRVKLIAYGVEGAVPADEEVQPSFELLDFRFQITWKIDVGMFMLCEKLGNETHCLCNIKKRSQKVCSLFSSL